MENLKSKNSQDHAQKPQRNYMFLNVAFDEFQIYPERCTTYAEDIHVSRSCLIHDSILLFSTQCLWL